MGELHKTGQLVPTSGIYKVRSPDGKALGKMPLAKGGRFPPFRGAGQRFELEREVSPKYTTVASAAVMEETAIQFAEALKRLASK
jgi:hypothetical protein